MDFSSAFAAAGTDTTTAISGGIGAVLPWLLPILGGLFGLGIVLRLVRRGRA